MQAKPNDQDRLDFLTAFALSLTLDLGMNQWRLTIGDRTAIGKTPRKTIDQAMKWTKRSQDK